MLMDILQALGVVMALTLLTAGLKGFICHNGVGFFELVVMLWRGDIKSGARHL